ncbi:MAG: c(7)-type cytochrome triheme protein [Desulforhopalus sp.]|jgi:c(7)-type cytochrome triheme protein
MKNIQILTVFAVLLLSAAMLFASGNGAPDEEYDEDTYGPKDPIVWVKPVKSVVFEHKVHTMGAELDCDSCHDELFEMESGVAEENEDFTMQTLYEGGYCGACHDGSTAFASNTRCTACHIGVRGHARLLGDNGVEKAH